MDATCTDTIQAKHLKTGDRFIIMGCVVTVRNVYNDNAITLQVFFGNENLGIYGVFYPLTSLDVDVIISKEM